MVGSDRNNNGSAAESIASVDPLHERHKVNDKMQFDKVCNESLIGDNESIKEVAHSGRRTLFSTG